MPSPFPGMNPYLEHPGAWPNVHHRLITAIADDLAPQLLPRYQIVVEERIYQVEGQDCILVGIPDVTVKQGQEQPQPPQAQAGNLAIAAPAAPAAQPLSVTLTIPETVRQGYLEVREIATGEVITVIEVLSPVNKRVGKGRIDYETKRSMILSSASHLVEIDLLRQWQPMPIQESMPPSLYHILVSAEEYRPKADLYTFQLAEPIPCFPLPLSQEEKTLPIVNLRSLLDGIYDRSGYGFVIDYTQPPVPPLSEGDAAWARDWLKRQNVIGD